MSIPPVESRIDRRFAALRAQNRAALVTYLMAGDPDAGTTVALMHALVAGGADVIELGVPFSDPVADGEAIQLAAGRALRAGMTVHGVLDLVRRFRADDAETPVVLMGYLNPIERMGYGAFAQAASTAGVDGVLTVDLPPEEGEGLLPALREAGLAPIFLVAPTTTDQRMAWICDQAQGFVYYVSLKGVTGAASLDLAAVGDRMAVLRRLTRLPVGVGFGISGPAQAAAVAAVADAVVVGSALVQTISGGLPAQLPGVLETQVRALRTAMDAAARPSREAN
ncbi:MAG TPA: tryptophan synthase subunit alpha [Candidatus Macondimonas sp.]|nr:tryptophan synthase subunit alpha [Candidatus Macondimonas sp.]